MDLVQLEDMPETFSPSEMHGTPFHGRKGHPILGEIQTTLNNLM